MSRKFDRVASLYKHAVSWDFATTSKTEGSEERGQSLEFIRDLNEVEFTGALAEHDAEVRADAVLITDAKVEAAARVLFAREEPDMNDWRWTQPNPGTPLAPFAWHDYWLDAARAALKAVGMVEMSRD